MDFDKALESVRSIRLSGGIFGKTTTLLIVLCVCVAAVCLKIGVWWFALALMLPLMGIITYAFKRCLDFAETNPQAAIMEGAELLVHERIVHGRKGLEIVPDCDPAADHTAPPLLDTDQPDAPPSPAIEDSSQAIRKEDK